MNTTNIFQKKLIFSTLLATFILSGCGGGSDASFSDANNEITIASCTLPLASWTTVNSGNVVSATNGSQIKFDHDSSGTKKVCVVSGTATLIKN